MTIHCLEEVLQEEHKDRMDWDLGIDEEEATHFEAIAEVRVVTEEVSLELVWDLAVLLVELVECY